MINLKDFIVKTDFCEYSDKELQEVVQLFEQKLCLGSVIDETVIIAADIAKQELAHRNQC